MSLVLEVWFCCNPAIKWEPCWCGIRCGMGNQFTILRPGLSVSVRLCPWAVTFTSVSQMVFLFSCQRRQARGGYSWVISFAPHRIKLWLGVCGGEWSGHISKWLLFPSPWPHVGYLHHENLVGFLEEQQSVSHNTALVSPRVFNSQVSPPSAPGDWSAAPFKCSHQLQWSLPPASWSVLSLFTHLFSFQGADLSSTSVLWWI